MDVWFEELNRPVSKQAFFQGEIVSGAMDRTP